jgi:hypothetical protein
MKTPQGRKAFVVSLGVLILFALGFTALFFLYDVPQLRQVLQEQVLQEEVKTYDSKYLSGVMYDTKTNIVTGNVKDVSDPGRYGVIVFINVSGEYFPKPYEESAVCAVQQDSSFRVQAYSDREPGDKTAGMFCVLLVDINLDYMSLAGQAEKEGKEAWELAQEYASDRLWDIPTYNTTL